MGQYQNQTLSILALSLLPGSDYKFLITNPNDLGIVSTAIISPIIPLLSIPIIARIDVNFMSNIVKRFENI